MKFVNATFSTDPLIVHSPNLLSGQFQRLTREIAVDRPRRRGNVDDLTVVTWNTKDETGIFEQCLARMEVDCLVLGRGIRRFNLRRKNDLLLEALENISTTYVLAVDDYDALVAGDLHDIIPRFLDTGKELLFNAADGHGGLPSTCKIDHRLYPRTRLQHLNTGAMIGKVEFCKTFYRAACDSALVVKQAIDYYGDRQAVFHDQTIMRAVALWFYPQVGIDLRCKIFTIPYAWQEVYVVEE